MPVVDASGIIFRAAELRDVGLGCENKDTMMGRQLGAAGRWSLHLPYYKRVSLTPSITPDPTGNNVQRVQRGVFA